MKDTKNKGLLVVSFGTSHNETCRQTIGAIEEHLAKATAGRRFYRAWTSRFIIKKLKERDGRKIDTVSDAMERMAGDGIEDLLVVPTHLLGGAEYDKMMSEVQEGGGAFSRVAVARPLLDSPEDLSTLATVIAEELLSEEDGASLVLMGHGSADKPEVNRVYVELEREFEKAGYPNVFIGTVEGEPSLDDAMDKLNKWMDSDRGTSCSRILLAPLMIVAGDHAVNDMAGEDPGSWKNRIRAGISRPEIDILPVLRGLGSYPGVQRMYEDHALKR